MSMASIADDLFTVKRAAKFLKVDESLVRRYIREKRIEAERLGWVWVIREAVLKKFAKEERPFGNPNFRRKKSA